MRLIDYKLDWLYQVVLIDKMKNQVEIVEIQTEISHAGKSQQHITKSHISEKYKTTVAIEDSDEDENGTIHIGHKIYGNLVLIRSETPHLSLGPDYCCFVPAFLAFSTASYFLILLVLSTAESTWFKVITLLVCVGQPLSYLLVALSNPGIVTTPLVERQDTKSCSKCRMWVPRHARHCGDCDLCVENYDHHCPWVSKCIGGNNLMRFYIFLGMTPIYFIYMTIAFVVCMSSNVLKVQQLSKTT